MVIDKWLLIISCNTIGRLLGKGSYGTVHLVRNKENNEYAMK